MIVNIFYWKVEHQSTELLGYLEGTGLLDIIHETVEVFFAMLHSLNAETTLNYFLENGGYTLSELKDLYHQLNDKLEVNELTVAEQNKIDQLLLSVIEVLGIASTKDSFTERNMI